MAATNAIPFPQVRWNLNALFSGIDDPKVNQTWEEVNTAADTLVSNYKGKIGQLSEEQFLEAIKAYETLLQNASKPVTYANLLFACNSTDPSIGAFLADQSERYSQLVVKVLFFDLEVQDLPTELVSKWKSSSVLAPYRHYLEVAEAHKLHKLSEPEEVVLEETANTGARAWVRYYEELLANAVFTYKSPEGEVQELTEPEVLALLRNPNRDVRLAAADSLTEGLEKLEKSIVFIYNTLMQDKKVGDRLRKHPYATHSRHMSNELPKEVVDLVVDLCVENYPLVSRFYKVKREILGLPKLTHVDRYAPLHETNEVKSYEEGKQIVLDSMRAFSPTLAEKAGEFFEKDWIDAEPRKGKQGGAFCHSITPDLHPVVFMNYQNKLDDVMTLAHELGHGVHGSLSRAQTYLNFHTTLPLAELASTFAEMLVFENLVKEATPESQLALYAEKIEGIFATIMRQAAMYRFEVRAHEARREEGELAPERLHEIFQEELQAMFGDSVELGEQHAKWWMYVGHFFFAPFYVYAYSIGELLVLALYERAKREGEAFAKKYEKLLTSGGSMNPSELMQIVDVDMTDRAFWQGGFDMLERMLTTFEGLRNSSSA